MGSEFLVGFVLGASAMAVLWVLVPWTRRIRAETGMDRELQTRLLLGEDPGDPHGSEPPPDPDHHRDYDAAEIEALRRLNQPGGGRRRERKGSRKR